MTKMSSESRQNIFPGKKTGLEVQWHSVHDIEGQKNPRIQNLSWNLDIYIF